MEEGVSPVGREKKGRNGHVGRLYLKLEADETMSDE